MTSCVQRIWSVGAGQIPDHVARRVLAVAAVFALISLSAISAQDASDSLESREEAAVRAAAERVADSVVQIHTIGGLDSAGQELPADGPTTGLVISADGYILSSTFNFTQQPSSIVVAFADGKQLPADLVATDHSRKLVMLKVDGVAELAVPAVAPAEEIAVGQWAVAIGRTFRTDRVNVAVGIVSAIERLFGKVLQTDAAVSTANYGGPLVDIRGRVLGVIVPIAPQGAGEVAGAEWYDSGIGFAVPLASVSGALERLKKGKDLHAGVLGVGFAAKNPHSSPAKLAMVRPDSPASRAGLKKGDRIVEVDGKPIKTQTDLRFALGARYEGEEVRIFVMRDDQRIEKAIQLAGELEVFRHAFLGILPRRPASIEPAVDDKTQQGADDSGQEVTAGEKQGVVVRMAYPDSPAAQAGIISGDRIVEINGSRIAGIDAAIEEFNSVSPGDEVALQLLRTNDSKEIKLLVARLPTRVPEQLPPAYAAAEPSDNADAAENASKAPPMAEGQTHTLKLAEFQESCEVYVPASRAAGRPQGMLLWLHAPGDADAKAIIGTWLPICDRDGVILVVPTAADAGKWERTELEYLRRLSERVIGQYKPDPHRIVVYGQGGGGTMACALALSSRDIFRGVATSAAPLPRQVRVPENEPAQRFAVFAGLSSEESAAAQTAQGLQRLADAGYPVTTISNLDSSGRLSDPEREELARWIDTLDRF